MARASPNYYAVVPASVSEQIRELAASASYAWGAIPVAALIGGTTFSTSLFPKDGRYLLPLRDAVRMPLGIALDDHVSVEMRLRPA